MGAIFEAIRLARRRDGVVLLINVHYALTQYKVFMCLLDNSPYGVKRPLTIRVKWRNPPAVATTKGGA